MLLLGTGENCISSLWVAVLDRQNYNSDGLVFCFPVLARPHTKLTITQACRTASFVLATDSPILKVGMI